MPAPALAAVALALLASAQGKAAAELPPPPEEPTAGVTRRYVVERIQFDGLERTRPSEVRRHLSIAEGALAERIVRILAMGRHQGANRGGGGERGAG